MMLLMLAVSIPTSAMSMSKVRENARFLTDRMAYELNLTPMQYDDVYEVNFDFIDNVRHIMNDVVRGRDYAVDRYYEFLDYRNDDLRWILSASQYRRFMGVEYFYRPIYTTANNWLFRIYKVYHDVKHFYFDKPHHYRTYKGGHHRKHYGNVSFYKNHRKEHYKHDFYQGDVRIRKEMPKATPKGNSRPVPNRKDVKPSDSKRTPEVRRSENERKEVKKDVRSGRRDDVTKKSDNANRKDVKVGVKSENRRRSEASSSRNSQKENKGSSRVTRGR
jgi:hypothetical protein